MFGRATITLDIGPHSGFNIGLSDEPGSGCGMWIRQILRIKKQLLLTDMSSARCRSLQ